MTERRSARRLSYDRQAILTDTLSAVAQRGTSPEQLLWLWNEQMQKLLGRPYRNGAVKSALEQMAWFRKQCVAHEADPARVIFALFDRARWMRRERNPRYRPSPTVVMGIRIFEWWRRWEKIELIMAGRNQWNLIERTAGSAPPDWRAARRSPSFRKVVALGLARLYALRKQYPRLSRGDLLENYGKHLPLIIRWALREPGAALTDAELAYLGSLSERDFFVAQLRQYEPTFILPDLKT